MKPSALIILLVVLITLAITWPNSGESGHKKNEVAGDEVTKTGRTVSRNRAEPEGVSLRRSTPKLEDGDVVRVVSSEENFDLNVLFTESSSLKIEQAKLDELIEASGIDVSELVKIKSSQDGEALGEVAAMDRAIASRLLIKSKLSQ